MPVGGYKLLPIVHEVASATVDGVELTADWNRQFETRVIEDYDSSPLFDLAALSEAESIEWCYGCGRCVPVCPVDLVGEYGPRKVHRKLQMGIDLLEDPDLWLCTTCGNCLRVCPKQVDMIKIMPAAREAAMTAGKEVPAELQGVLEATFKYGNALGQSPRRRSAWTKGAGVPVRDLTKEPGPVDYLFYVEDYWSYHPRGHQAAQAFARILHQLGIDYGILGHEERTLGDSQRLAGEKGLFEMLMEQVVETLDRHEFGAIVTPDPHGFNALATVYPKYGHTFEVLHYTQLLAPRVSELTFTTPLDVKVTFHDPCYLGRHNGEYDAPRRLLEAIPGLELIEMMRCRENGYCCGGGGGGMWLDGHTQSHTSERLSVRRVKEAAETGADVLAVCCPYEVSRFEDGAKAAGVDDRLRVLDIAELLDMALGGPDRVAGA
ncbi:(Fe-S)-binding protein [Conexibacter sp. DBS9H8]|uniref:(Fe-S)-binding protein n=1 Tax=Conexibacter sp. DBS9H8 TaxID=2937801 RepID=UPI00200F9D83|nr:(Fe-S)-binding protein [Conexibacter sp. DBS9H8]